MTLALALLSVASAQPTPAPPVESPAPVEAEPAPEVEPASEAPEDAGVPAEDAEDAPSIPAASDAATPGDRFLMNQKLTLDEPSGDNVFAMAQSLTVDSPVAGDVFVMAEEVEIAAPVSGDVYGLAARVQIRDGGSVGGNVMLGAGELYVGGPVAGSIHAELGELELAGPVAGDVDIEAQAIEVSGGTIAGDLEYSAPERSPALEAATSGQVVFDQTFEADGDLQIEEEAESSLIWSAAWWTGMRGWGFLTKLLVGALLLLLGGERMAAIGRRAASHPGQSLGIGFLVASALPMIALFSLVTVLPFPVGLLGFAVWLILLYVGQIFTAQAIGDLLLKRIQPDAVGNAYLSLAVGLVPLILIVSVPWLGTVAWFAATIAGIGAGWAILRGHA